MAGQNTLLLAGHDLREREQSNTKRPDMHFSADLSTFLQKGRRLSSVTVGNDVRANLIYVLKGGAYATSFSDLHKSS